MQSTLGKIKKITDLRSVWAHEEYDFSQWLAEEENLALLSDAVGIDIMLEELESPVGLLESKSDNPVIDGTVLLHTTIHYLKPHDKQWKLI